MDQGKLLKEGLQDDKADFTNKMLKCCSSKMLQMLQDKLLKDQDEMLMLDTQVVKMLLLQDATHTTRQDVEGRDQMLTCGYVR